MFTLNENDREYRFGDSGPRYLMKGPRSNFAVVQFQAGQDFKAHYHNVMEENFFIPGGRGGHRGGRHGASPQAGRPDSYRARRNPLCDQQLHRSVKMISTLAPFTDPDKIEVDNYTY